jgi:PhzF family phenazine biosynthesis protein
MNLSETAFAAPSEDGWALRWFTPTVEVELCGHATLAAAHVLWESERLRSSEPARFHTLSGLLTAARDGEWITLDFPATPVSPAAAPEGLSAALGATPRFVGQTRFDHFLELESEAALRDLRPNVHALGGLPGRGFIVTARAESVHGGYDFVSRCFAPAVGIDEDPVTGSAHCGLGPYWAEKLGRADLVGFQCSARGGRVRVRVEGDRVVLGGRAVTVLRGELLTD